MAVSIKRLAKLAWAGCLTPALAGGCNVFYYATKNAINEPIELCDQLSRTHHLRQQAKDYWKEVRKQYPRKAFTAEFRDGFVDGYADYLDRGGDAVVPAVPPKRYTRNDYLTPEGHERIRDYFLGFKYGLDVALATGQRPFLTVPVLVPERQEGPPTFNVQPGGQHIPAPPEGLPTPTPVPKSGPLPQVPPPPEIKPGTGTGRPRPQPFAGATVIPGAATAREPVKPADPPKPAAARPPVVRGPKPPADAPGDPPPKFGPHRPTPVAGVDTEPGTKFGALPPIPAVATDPDALPAPNPPLPIPHIPAFPAGPDPTAEVDPGSKFGPVPPPADGAVTPGGFTIKLPEPPPEVPTLPDHVPTPSVHDELPAMPASHTIPAPLPANHTIPQRK
jgi:hypothetical protein